MNNSNYKKDTSNEVEPKYDERIIEYVGLAGDKEVGLEFLKNDDEDWDVIACFFDDNPYINNWVSIGNAEEINHFKTIEEARKRGLHIIEEELGPIERYSK